MGISSLGFVVNDLVLVHTVFLQRLAPSLLLKENAGAASSILKKNLNAISYSARYRSRVLIVGLSEGKALKHNPCFSNPCPRWPE